MIGFGYIIVLSVFAAAHERSSPCEPAMLELRLIPELVEDVVEGRKSSSVRAGNQFDIVPGPALFKVPGADVTVPIVIEAVGYRKRLKDLSTDELRAQGPFVARILAREGRVPAIRAILLGMRTYYPGFRLNDDVTVVHFRPLQP